jgi:hypothetical protein
MNELKATVVGFLTAAVIPAVAISAAIGSTNGIDSLLSIYFPLLAFGLYPVVLFVAVLFGLPSFLLLRRLGLVRWWSASGAGMLFGLAAGLMFVYPAVHQPPRSWIAWGLIGILTSLTFWVIWSRHRILKPIASKLTS